MMYKEVIALINKNFETKYYFHADERIRHDGTYALEPHCHNLFEIYFITEGQCRYFIDGISFSLHAGDLMLIPAGVIHNSEYSESVHSRLLINCDSEMIPPEVREDISHLLYLYRNPEIISDIRGLFRKIGEEYSRGDELSYGILGCYTRMLFYLLLRNADSRYKIEGGNNMVSAVINAMKNELPSDITLKGMAKRFSVSEEHLSRLFKRETGTGFCNYLTVLRMRKAKELLLHSSECRITEIAHVCGYSDSNYFSSQFKKHYGASPKRFQKKGGTSEEKSE